MRIQVDITNWKTQWVKYQQVIIISYTLWKKIQPVNQLVDSHWHLVTFLMFISNFFFYFN